MRPWRKASVKTVASGSTISSPSQASADGDQEPGRGRRPLRRHASHRRPLRASASWSEIDREQRAEGEHQHGQRRSRRRRHSRTRSSLMTISSGAISERIGMLPAMKITEPYSPTARAKARREAGEQGRRDRRQDDADGAPPGAGAERRGGLLDLGVEVLQHRLHRADDERQADEDQRDQDAERRVGDLDRQAAPAGRRSSRSARTARPARCRRPRSAGRTAGRPGRRPAAGPGNS